MENELGRLFGKVKIEEPQIKIVEDSETEGTVVIEPLIRGYGSTVGNSLRRVMLASLPGAAVVSISINSNGTQVLHEISTVTGVKEDVCEIILNVKGIVAKLYSDSPVIAYIDADSEGVITAGDINCSGELEIVNPDQKIATISAGTHFRMELVFDNGVGYIPSDKNKEKYGEDTVGLIYVDSIYTPVLNVNYVVDNTRVGSRMDYDKLTLSVKTDGSITPKGAVVIASEILKEHFALLTSLSGEAVETNMMTKSKEEQLQESLDRPIDEMDLSVRSYNCLKRQGINTIGEVIDRSLDELMKIRNLGKKSYDEIEQKIKAMGLSFREDED